MITFPNNTTVPQERSHPSSVSLIRNINFLFGRIWTFISLTSHVSIQLIRRINGASQPIFKTSQTRLPCSLLTEKHVQPLKDERTSRIEQASTESLPPQNHSGDYHEEPQLKERDERETPTPSPKKLPPQPLSPRGQQDPLSILLNNKEPTLHFPPESATLEWPQSPQSSRDNASPQTDSSELTSPRVIPSISRHVPPINLHLALQSKGNASHKISPSTSPSSFSDDENESLYSSHSSRSATSSDFDDELEELMPIEDDLLETCLIETFLEDYQSLEDALEAADIYDAKTQNPIDTLAEANGTCILIWPESVTYIGDLHEGRLHGSGLFYQGLPRDPQKKVLIEGEFYENRFVSGWINYQNERIYESTSFENGELTTPKGTLRFSLKGTPVEYRGEIQNGLPHGMGKILRHTKNGSEIVEEGKYERGCLVEGIREESHQKIGYATIKTYYEGCFKNGLKDGDGILKKVHNFCRGDETFTFTTEIEANYEQDEETLQDALNLFWSDGAEGTLYLNDDSPYAEIKLTNGSSYTLYPASLNDLSDVAFITGKGILRSADGDQYEGDLKDAYMDGKGKITYADGRTEEGVFRKNTLITTN